MMFPIVSFENRIRKPGKYGLSIRNKFQSNAPNSTVQIKRFFPISIARKSDGTLILAPKENNRIARKSTHSFCLPDLGYDFNIDVVLFFDSAKWNS